MEQFEDVSQRSIVLTEDRQRHIQSDHPEMSRQMDKIRETLKRPDDIVRSRTDPEVELFYRRYDDTPVSEKSLCVVVKVLPERAFIITAYFTDTIKQGEKLWLKK